jgi:hypothetical protein
MSFYLSFGIRFFYLSSVPKVTQIHIYWMMLRYYGPEFTRCIYIQIYSCATLPFTFKYTRVLHSHLYSSTLVCYTPIYIQIYSCATLPFIFKYTRVLHSHLYSNTLVCYTPIYIQIYSCATFPFFCLKQRSSLITMGIRSSIAAFPALEGHKSARISSAPTGWIFTKFDS